MPVTITKLKTQDVLIDDVIRAAPARPREADPFPLIVQNQFDQLCISRIALRPEVIEAESRQIRRANRLAMIKAFNEAVAELQQRVADINRLLAGIIEAQVRSIAAGNREAWALRGEKVGSMFAKLKRPSLQVLDVLHAELMARSDGEVLETLRVALLAMTRDVVRQFQDVLQTLQSQRSIGSITWFAKDVCKYHYYEYRRGSRAITNTSKREERIRESNAWVTYEIVSRNLNLEKFDVCTRVEHHLFCAARYQFPASAVKRPKHLAPLFASIPAWLAPHIFVVEGDMLRETVEDQTRQVSLRQLASQEVGYQEINREEIRTGVNYSPAVTLGSFVIGGWAKADL